MTKRLREVCERSFSNSSKITEKLFCSRSQVHPHLLAVDLRGHKITKMKPSKCLFFGFNQWMGIAAVCFTVPNFSSILQGSRSLKSTGTRFLTPTSNTSFAGRVQMFPVYVNSTFAVPEDLVHNVYWQGNYLLESCGWFVRLHSFKMSRLSTFWSWSYSGQRIGRRSPVREIFFPPGMVGERIFKGFLPTLLFENVGDSYDRKSREETHS